MNVDSRVTKNIVVGDVDILNILTTRAESNEIYFLKLRKQNVASMVYSSKSFEADYPLSAKFILFLHCYTGCDTNSAIYNKGIPFFWPYREAIWFKMKGRNTLQL